MFWHTCACVCQISCINWSLIEGVATTSAYADHVVKVDSALGYTMLKIDAVGAQIRVANFTLTVVD